MPTRPLTNAEALQVQKKKAAVAKQEARDLAELVADLETQAATAQPAQQLAKSFLRDGGAVVQGVAETVDLVGPLKLGHVTLGLGLIGRAAKAFAPPGSALDYVTEPFDEMVSFKIGLAAHEAAKARKSPPKQPTTQTTDEEEAAAAAE